MCRPSSLGLLRYITNMIAADLLPTARADLIREGGDIAAYFRWSAH
jgi:hypothetical protein